jgi:nucleoid DNA-binding protein
VKKVKIAGFGIICCPYQCQGKGRNPRTGAEIVIRERNVLAFKGEPDL